MKRIETTELETPIGRVRLAVADGALCALDFDEGWAARQAALERRFGDVVFGEGAGADRAAQSVGAYFRGNLDALETLDVDPAGTPFQKAVWRALRAIPAGATRSYADIARAIGAPSATRAVGAANAKNPIALAIPCHRVIRGDGSLCGYAGGTARKEWLLRHEGAALL